MFDPITLGVMSGVSQALPSIFSFFDNSEGNAKYEQDKARVNAINRDNKSKQFDNLGIRARKLSQQNEVKRNIDNIKLADSNTLASKQLALDRAEQNSLVANEKDMTEMFQRMTGSQTGRVNRDGSMLAQIGRASSQRRSALMRGRDDFTTSGYQQRQRSQNSIAQQLAKVSLPVQYKQYQTSYTPQKYGKNMLKASLGLAGGVLGGIAGGYDTYKGQLPDLPTDDL